MQLLHTTVQNNYNLNIFFETFSFTEFLIDYIYYNYQVFNIISATMLHRKKKHLKKKNVFAYFYFSTSSFSVLNESSTFLTS